MARPNDLVLIFCDAITRSLEADHLLPPHGGAEAGAAGAPGRRRRLRRAGGLPHPERRARRPHRAGRLTDAQPMAAARRRQQARRHRRPARGQQRRGLRRDAPALRRPDPRLPDRLLRARRRSGAESAAGLPQPRLRGRGRAAHRRATPAASPTTARSVARVAAFGSVYFTGGDQAKIVAALAPGGGETPLLAAIRAAQAAGGLVAGSSAGAAMMSQPMILGGTSIESVVHGVTDDPETPGPADGHRPRLLPLRHASTSTSSSAAASAGSWWRWRAPACAAASASTRTPRSSSRAAPRGSAASTA